MNVLKMSQQQQIQSLIRLGWSNRRISRETGMSRITVARYRSRFQSSPQVPAGVLEDSTQSSPLVPTDSGLLYPATKSLSVESHREVIWRKYTEGLSGQRIYQDLVEEDGYTGSYYSIKRFVRKIRGELQLSRFEVLPTQPGQEAQVDFAKGALVFHEDKHRWAWLFKMTLSFSGHAYEELVFSQDVETFLRCHEHAFSEFGGVPAMVKLDNLKSGVLQACLYDPVVNPQYRAFSEHWGFIPHPCAPRKPHHKGRVERDVCYTVNNALKGRKFESLADGNLYLKHWNKRWARTRIHGSKKCQVWKLFAEYEQKALGAVAEKPFPFFKLGARKVSLFGQIEVLGNYYPLPEAYLGETVEIHFNREDVRVYRKQILLKIFRTLSGKGRIAGACERDRPQRPAFLEALEGRLCAEARAIGPHCYALVRQILSREEDPMAIRRVRGINGLVNRYPSPVVDFACQSAMERHRPFYPAVKEACDNILATGAAQPSVPRLTQQHALIRSPHEYQALLSKEATGQTMTQSEIVNPGASYEAGF